MKRSSGDALSVVYTLRSPRGFSGEVSIRDSRVDSSRATVGWAQQETDAAITGLDGHCWCNKIGEDWEWG